MSDKTDWSRKNKEIHLAMAEFESMMVARNKRNADPLVVSSIGIVKFVALVGPLFERETDYMLFINKCVTQGILMHRQQQEDDESGNPKYIH